jgi:apolipoprotein N-acyltransferase
MQEACERNPSIVFVILLFSWMIAGLAFSHAIDTPDFCFALLSMAIVFTSLIALNGKNFSRKIFILSTAFWAVALRWMLEELNVVGLMLYVACIFIGNVHLQVVCMAYSRCETSILRLSIAPLAWAGLEEFRNYISIGMPWYFLCYAFSDVPVFIQSADTLGAAGVSGLALLVTLTLIETCRLWFDETTKVSMPVVIVSFTLIGSNLLYGNQILNERSREGGSAKMKVGIVQTNLTIQRLNRLNGESIAHEWHSLTSRAAALNPDITITPELVFPTPLSIANYCGIESEVVPENWLISASPIAVNENSADLLKRYLCTIPREHLIIVGAKTTSGDYGLSAFNNSAVVINPLSRITAAYAKRMCIPLFESDVLGKSLCGAFPFIPGKWNDDLTIPLNVNNEIPISAAILICYEDALSSIYHRYWMQSEQEKPKKLVFLSIGNESMTLSTRRHHIAAVKFRAIEFRSPVVRAVNTGVSGNIDAYGILESSIPECSESGGEGEVIIAAVDFSDLQAWYPLYRGLLCNFYALILLMVTCTFLYFLVLEKKNGNS